MNNRLKLRVSVELALAILSSGLFLLTLVSREWIEALTGWDPDHRSGSVEWFIVGVLCILSLSLSIQARSDWRKVQALPA